MSSKDGGPAFPMPETVRSAASPGMTLRDYFAAHALVGVIIRNREGEYVHEAAYDIADKMIAERAK